MYLTGTSAVQYAVGTGGPIALINNSTQLYSSATAMSTLKSMITGTSTNILANEHAKVTKRALDTYTQLNGALAGGARAPTSRCSRPATAWPTSSRWSRG